MEVTAQNLAAVERRLDQLESVAAKACAVVVGVILALGAVLPLVGALALTPLLVAGPDSFITRGE